MQNTPINLTSSINPTDFGIPMQKNADDMFTDNLNNLRTLIQNGIIPVEQGQNYVMNLIKNTFQIPLAPQTDAPTQMQAPVLQPAMQTQNPQVNARQSILDYFQNTGVNQEDMNTLSGYLTNYANEAVNKYKQQLSQNENAKQRLYSNAQNTTSDTKIDRVYSAQEIGKMTTEEFLRNEDAIMDQLRKGKIR